MPFHVAYSGPAPISTFFRIRELEEDANASGSNSSPSQGNPSSESKDENDKGKEVNGVTSTETEIGKKHLVAAFRGRLVVGTDVPLPEGYTGLVLRSDGLSKTEETSQRSLSNGTKTVKGGARSGRKASIRKTRRPKVIEVNSDDDDANPITPVLDETGPTMDLDGAVDPELTLNGESSEEDVKTLRATGTFQSLVVWNADVPVDEGRDEYIRALREWTAAAAEVGLKLS